jgi:hypothetical protein
LNKFIQSLTIYNFNQRLAKENKHRPISKGLFPRLDKKNISFSLVDNNLMKDLQNLKVQSQCIQNQAKLLFDIYQHTPHLLLCKQMYGRSGTIPNHALIEDKSKLWHFERCIYIPCNSLAMVSDNMCQLKLAKSYILALSKQGEWNMFYGQCDESQDEQTENLTIYDKIFSTAEVKNIITRMHNGIQ